MFKMLFVVNDDDVRFESLKFESGCSRANFNFRKSKKDEKRKNRPGSIQCSMYVIEIEGESHSNNQVKAIIYHVKTEARS